VTLEGSEELQDVVGALVQSLGYMVKVFVGVGVWQRCWSWLGCVGGGWVGFGNM
jgi:hypothetical protein